MTVPNLDDRKVIAQILSKREEILAVEFSQDKRIFGVKAGISEMSKFKSKIKKQEVVWDPEVESKKAEEKLKAEREKVKKEREG